MMILTIIFTTLWMVLLFSFLFTIYIIWKYERIETYAVMMNKDGHKDKLKINPNKDHFRYEKGSYIIPQDKKYMLKLHRKNYIRYMEGTPEPYLWFVDDKPAIPSDVFKSIIESSSLKLLNTPPLTFDWKMILIIGGIILLAIFLITKFTGGAT